VPGAPPPQKALGVGPESGEKVTRRKKGRDKRKGGKDGEEGGPAEEGEQPTSGPTAVGVNGSSSPALADSIAAPEPTVAEGGLDPLQKKIRNLTKKVRFRPRACIWKYPKSINFGFSFTWHANIVHYATHVQLKAIEELKDKAKSGTKLETTQYKKIETEAEIRRELAGAIAAVGGAA